MREFNNVGQLQDYLMSQINDAMGNEVLEAVKEVEIETIGKVVYDVFTPVWYKRRYDDGGIADPNNIVGTITRGNNSCEMFVQNITPAKMYNESNGGKPYSDSPSANSGYVAGIVESGSGYEYSPHPGARPFTKKTIMKLKREKQCKSSLAAGLSARGIEVE